MLNIYFRITEIVIKMALILNHTNNIRYLESSFRAVTPWEILIY